MRSWKRRSAALIACLLVLALAACAPPGSATDAAKYPTKDITWIVPFSAGSYDTLARWRPSWARN